MIYCRFRSFTILSFPWRSSLGIACHAYGRLDVYLRLGTHLLYTMHLSQALWGDTFLLHKKKAIQNYRVSFTIRALKIDIFTLILIVIEDLNNASQISKGFLKSQLFENKYTLYCHSIWDISKVLHCIFEISNVFYYSPSLLLTYLKLWFSKIITIRLYIAGAFGQWCLLIAR